MNTLTLLREAARAKLAYWDASRTLEIHLGLDDVPDRVDAAIQDTIASIASSVDDPDEIGEDHVLYLEHEVSRAR
jgi:hypothetical protein